MKGLETIGDSKGSKCVEVISEGLGALDESGIDVKGRIKLIITLKTFLEANNNFVDRLKRPGREDITNELLQMVMTTLDSYIYTFMNLQFFNVRRKG